MGFDPATMILGSAFLSGGNQIYQGLAANSQAKAEAAQYDQNAKAELIAADQADAERRRDLMGTLSAIHAVRTSRELDVASPTGVALAADSTDRAQRAIDTSNLNYRNRSQSDKTMAGIRRSQGTAALVGGFLKGGSSMIGGISDYGRYGGK